MSAELVRAQTDAENSTRMMSELSAAVSEAQSTVAELRQQVLICVYIFFGVLYIT